MSQLVTCLLKRSYVYQGKPYGPGSAVLVPTGLQIAMNLPIIAESKPAPSTGDAPAPLPPLGELAAHLATLDLDGLVVLQSRDQRKGAIPMYEARFAELAKAGSGSGSSE